MTLAPITNFVGQLETAPVGWGYCSFGTNHGVMGLGINVAWPNSDSSRPYYQSRNWMHRATRSWGAAGNVPNAVTIDAGGHPTAIVAANGTAYAGMISTLFNSVNTQGLATVNGVWSFIATENAGGPLYPTATPMVVSLTGTPLTTVTALPGSPTGTSPGTKVWQWHVHTPNGTGAAYACGLTLEVQTPGGGPGPWTLSDEWFLTPQAFAPAPVGDINVTAYGSGYTAPTATLTGGGGTGATATVGALANGAIIAATVTSGGTGYNANARPTVTVSGGGGTGFAAFVNILGGAIASVVVSNCGSGYTSAPTLGLSGGSGTGAVLTAAAPVNGVITSISVGNPGSNYTSSPAVTIADATGSGATAWASCCADPRARTSRMRRRPTRASSRC